MTAIIGSFFAVAKTRCKLSEPLKTASIKNCYQVALPLPLTIAGKANYERGLEGLFGSLLPTRTDQAQH